MTADAVKPAAGTTTGAASRHSRPGGASSGRYELFLERGYPGTTMAQVARAAGVSVETVYKSFRNKAALAKQLWDVTLVSDDQPVPLAQRPEFAHITAEAEPGACWRPPDGGPRRARWSTR